MFVAACWLLVKRTFEAVCFCLKLCLFVLFFCFVCFCLVMVYDVWQQYFFFFTWLLVVFKLKIVSETAWRESPKKWDLLLLIDLIWVEDILTLGYTKIFVISYIPGSKPPNILYWISKGTLEIVTTVFELSGLVISE